MLCQFLFQNFRSYKEETVFDLQAAAIPELADSLIPRRRASGLLPVSVVYGPNGGGKTNLLKALACVIGIVVKPIYDLGMPRTDLVIQQAVRAEPFLYDAETPEQPTEFHLCFCAGECEYRYEIGLLRGEITTETLYRKKRNAKKPAHIFYRAGQEIQIGQLLRRAHVSTNVNAKMPYLSFLAINYDIPAIIEVQKWFESCIICSYASPMIERRIMASDDMEFKKQLLILLNDMGVDITDYRYEHEDDQLYLKREIAGQEYELTFEQESGGTKKLIAALPALLLALQEGRLAIIDELDTRLHPKLLRHVISMFTNPELNRHGAQLLFTSHDISTMKKTVFRRDEIWLAALNKNRSSEIRSLYAVRREDNERVNGTAAFGKQYLEGRYGAEPHLQTMLNAEEWS